jgi:hypothetical protein
VLSYLKFDIKRLLYVVEEILEGDFIGPLSEEDCTAGQGMGGNVSKGYAWMPAELCDFLLEL